jgi:hypothetical protein
MRVVVEYYFNGLEQRCTGIDKQTGKPCKFVVGPYSEAQKGACPYCQGRLEFFQAFGTEEERRHPLSPIQAYNMANTDNEGNWWGPLVEWWEL